MPTVIEKAGDNLGFRPGFLEQKHVRLARFNPVPKAFAESRADAINVYGGDGKIHSLITGCGVAFRDFYYVLQQHRPGHWAYAARIGRIPSRFFPC